MAFPIAESAQKTYWVKRDLINSQNITTDDVTKGTILFNSLNPLYPENPIKFTFQEVFSPGSSDEALVDLATTKTCQDSDGDTWYEVKLPFDDKGDLHYLGVLLGVNRTAQEKGWVKASDTELTTALNWPGFKIAKETGEGSQDAKIDFKNLTPFFKELFEDIDTSGNGAISAREMKAALKDSVLADRLSRVIAKHPSEWQADPALSKWQYLEKLVPDAAAFEEAKKQIKNLAWWDDAQCAGADLPMSPEVYHLHPLSYLQQLNTILETESIAVEARIRAFLRMIRVGEGTIGDRGYETLFGHKSFIQDYNKDWSTHPNIQMPFGDTTSSAAGAYQVLVGTWSDYKSRARKYGVTSFSKIHQDIFGVTLLRHKVKGTPDGDHFIDEKTGRRMNALDLIIADRIDDAIKISSYEWASLPPSRYGQPSTTPLKAKEHFDFYLIQELKGASDLEVKSGQLIKLFFRD